MAVSSVIKLEANPRIQDFGPGDSVKVNYRVREGERERIQAFIGVVIKRRGEGPGANFTVRRVTQNIGVERTFPFYSPRIESVEVVRRGKVRRARLYYLRGRFGRAGPHQGARPLLGLDRVRAPARDAPTGGWRGYLRPCQLPELALRQAQGERE